MNFRIQKGLLVLLILAQVSLIYTILQQQHTFPGRHAAWKFPWPRNWDPLCSEGPKRRYFNALTVSQLRTPLVVKSSNMSSGKGATPCLWLHRLEHGHYTRELRALVQEKHFCLGSDLHGSLWSLLHCSYWWNHYNVGVTNENVVIQGLLINNIIFDFMQVLLLEPTFLGIWKTPRTRFQRWISGTTSIPASIPLFREHCLPLLAPMLPTCTLVFRCSWKQ